MQNRLRLPVGDVIRLVRMPRAMCARWQGRPVHMSSVPIKSRDKLPQLPDVPVGATDGECAAYLKRIVPTESGRLKAIRHDYIRASSLFRQVVAARHKLRRYGGRLGESSYLVLFKVCSKLGAHDFVKDLILEMEAYGVSQTPSTLALAMETAIVAKHDPTPYLAELESLKVPPNAGIQKAYLGYLMKRTCNHTPHTLEEREVKAKAFLATVPQPSLTARTLIIGCCKDVESAKKHMQRLPRKMHGMQEIGGLLLRVCMDTGDHESADKIIETLMSRGTATAAHWNTVLLTYLKAGASDKVPHGIERMLSAGFAADTFTYSTYFTTLAIEARECGQQSVAKAEALFSLAMNQDMCFAQKIYGGLLEVYAATGDLTKAAALRTLQREKKVRESARFIELYRLCEQQPGLIPSAKAVHLSSSAAKPLPHDPELSLSTSHVQDTPEVDQLRQCLKSVPSRRSDSRWYAASN